MAIGCSMSERDGTLMAAIVCQVFMRSRQDVTEEGF